MRRLLTTLVILLVVLAAGMSALVILIDPNDFRQYMIKQVKQRTGYQLKIDGHLRWHVWPQLSIISKGMSLTESGAEQPVIRADNMRLDVRLWPLLSHHLEVKQVLLNGGIILLTPASEAAKVHNAPGKLTGSVSRALGDVAWRLDIRKVRIDDSLIVWQRINGEQINLRNVNLHMNHDGGHQAKLSLESVINHNQRDLALKMKANLDLSHYPNRYQANISQLDYQLSGAGLPVKGITGRGSMQLNYQKQPVPELALSQIHLIANDSEIQGNITITAAKAGYDYRVDMDANRLNLDNLLDWQPRVNSSEAQQENKETAQPSQRSPSPTRMPVIAQEDLNNDGDDFAGLRAMSITLKMAAPSLIYHGLDIKNASLSAASHDGKLVFNPLKGEIGEGVFSIQGSIDASQPGTVRSTFAPMFKDIALSPLLRAAAFPDVLAGNISLQGQLSGEGFSLQDMVRQGTGEAALSINNLDINGLNIHQIISQFIASSKDVYTEENSRNTQLQTVTASAKLRNGIVSLDTLQGRSDKLAISGQGQFNLLRRRCDMQLNTHVSDLKGKERVVKELENITIPLHIYGDWQKLNYSLNAGKALRDDLKDKAKSVLQRWAKKHKEKKE